jgi:hypothetical protein
LTKLRRCSRLMASTRRSSEVKRSPLGLIVCLCKDLLDLAIDLPCLQAFCRSPLFDEAPFYEALAFSTDPLSVDIDVDVNINTSFYVYAKIRCRYRLSQGRSGRDGREEGENDLDVFGLLQCLWRPYRVCEVRGRCIVLRALVGRVCDGVAGALRQLIVSASM